MGISVMSEDRTLLRSIMHMSKEITVVYIYVRGRGVDAVSVVVANDMVDVVADMKRLAEFLSEDVLKIIRDIMLASSSSVKTCVDIIDAWKSKAQRI